MGYTRYWNRTDKPLDEDFVEFCKGVVEDCKRRGIRIRDGFGENEPVITTEKIWINGDADINSDHETFYIGSETGFEFCKTARKPYDYAVRKILSEAKKRGFVTKVSSDGAERRIISDERFVKGEY